MKDTVKDSERPFRKLRVDIFNFLFPLLVPSWVPVASYLNTASCEECNESQSKALLAAGCRHSSCCMLVFSIGNNEMGQGFKMLQNVLAFLFWPSKRPIFNNTFFFCRGVCPWFRGHPVRGKPPRPCCWFVAGRPPGVAPCFAAPTPTLQPLDLVQEISKFSQSSQKFTKKFWDFLYFFVWGRQSHSGLREGRIEGRPHWSPWSHAFWPREVQFAGDGQGRISSFLKTEQIEWVHKTFCKFLFLEDVQLR